MNRTQESRHLSLISQSNAKYEPHKLTKQIETDMPTDTLALLSDQIISLHN